MYSNSQRLLYDKDSNKQMGRRGIEASNYNRLIFVDNNSLLA